MYRVGHVPTDSFTEYLKKRKEFKTVFVYLPGILIELYEDTYTTVHERQKSVHAVRLNIRISYLVYAKGKQRKPGEIFAHDNSCAKNGHFTVEG